MKFFQVIAIIVLVLAAIIAIPLLASTIYHQSQLRKEARACFPPGSMVVVDGKKLHVYSEGEGELTLVFMSGHGTHHPALDFKPLWMRLVDEYRIAVVERPGYGWSESSNRPRDIGAMLEETRQALELSGERGPFVLFPHSMSGLEAIYWAQKYPHEVKAIIGLDPLTPATFEILPAPDKTQLYAMYWVSRTGISRFMPEADVEKNFPLMKSADLTEEEKQNYLAVFYKSAFSKDMLREVDYLRANARTVAENGVPASTPMYFFISEEQDAGVPGWMEAASGYLSNAAVGRYMQLAAGHYVHYEMSEVIAEEAKAFLEEVKEITSRLGTPAVLAEAPE